MIKSEVILALLAPVSIAVLGGCAHHSQEQQEAAERRAKYQRLGEMDLQAHLAMFRGFAQSLPRCADGEATITVEEALKREWTPGDCLVVEGELVLDVAPSACEHKWHLSSHTCPAAWFLLASPPSTPRPQSLPGVRRYLEGARSLLLHNHDPYLYDVPCNHDFLANCDEDNAGNPRMPTGTRFHLPEAYRQKTKSPGEGEVPPVRVAILGAVRDPCVDYLARDASSYAQNLCQQSYESKVRLASHGFDMSSICRMAPH